MQQFLWELKDKVDATLLKNAQRVEKVTYGMWLIIAGILFFYAFHFESLLVRIVVATLMTMFTMAAYYIVRRFRKLPEEDRAETYIFWQWHPYFLFACLVLFSCLMWGVIFLRR